MMGRFTSEVSGRFLPGACDACFFRRVSGGFDRGVRFIFLFVVHFVSGYCLGSGVGEPGFDCEFD